MKASPPALRRRIVALLRAECAAAEGFEALLEACGAQLGERARAQLARAPVEAENEQLAHWLVAELEGEEGREDELDFRIALESWRGRVDAADLERIGGDARAGSAVLARIAQAARWEPEEEALALGELLALGYAALALRQALERVDAGLALGGHESRAVSVELPGRALFELGRYGRAGWDSSSARLVAAHSRGEH